ncbi:sulfite exporter TauE/SafE family protein [Bacillus sp. WMMC1349]|uniref:sulfite exporter TauE/SafE family protein n=1 Tax=Bacillus sp. WMMC1349 TaxID=2736254 RepID=UPI001552C498|nr:sulfite exporter TauE/SafE family protein [Bacillus sp. WMMC1349]NPC94063.1 sulfite exporter TauE/SafE family protein [Bacillus sp. WMMC1349]
MEYIILIILGFIAGTIGGLVGLGGGIVIVPSLLFLSGIAMFDHITPQIAVGTSLFVIIFTGLSSTITYMKYNTVDYKSGLIFFIGSGPGSIIGAHVSKYFSSSSFSLSFGIFMILLSLSLMIKKKERTAEKKHIGVIRTFKNDEGNDYTYSYQPIFGIAIAFVVGFLGGLFGIGGGSLMVPAMLLIFLFPTRVAVATSMFIIFLSSVTGSLGHVISGHVNWLYALALIPGAWYGGKLGAIINKKMNTKTIVVILRLVLILIGLRLVYQGIFS